MMRVTDKYVFFYGGEFSQWFPCIFIDENGLLFNCAEQYMMYKKAMLFGDVDAANRIMATNQPSKQKFIGRCVQNFDKEVWELHARDYVAWGNFYKFIQNQDLLKVLKSTDGKLLVEASPDDTIWGVGLGVHDKRVDDPKNWQGTNWLGEVITGVRERIKDLFGEDYDVEVS